MTVTITPTNQEIVHSCQQPTECCCKEYLTDITDETEHPHDHTESLLEDLANEEICQQQKMLQTKLLYRGLSYTKPIKSFIVDFEEAPEFMKHNAFIRTGYRILLNTELCIQSVFWWTNESINIWSHIFGLVLFISLTIWDLMILKIDAPLSDKILVGGILICFQLCMALSALYHTFCCRSEKDCEYYLGLDLFGIALSLFGIYVSGVYYAFWCDLWLQNFYLLTVTVIFVIAMVLQMPSLNVDNSVKLATFVSWAAYGVVPTLHWAVKMGGFENPVVNLLLPRVFGMYAISGIAFFIYITKIPERFAAGKFDYIGHSHQWWHFFVVGALYYWHNTGMLYVDYRLNHACANSMRIP